MVKTRFGAVPVIATAVLLISLLHLLQFMFLLLFGMISNSDIAVFVNIKPHNVYVIFAVLVSFCIKGNRS